MKLDPINLIGGFYQDDNLPWSAQDTVNWIPRPAEAPGTLSPMKLVGAPGLRFLVDIDPAPIRIGGLHNAEGKRFAVAGTTLYEVHSDFTTTARGTIPGAGPVTMQHNQLEFGNEVSIGNGSGSLYVWNTWTNTFTVVADDAATGSVQTVYLNRRLIHMDPFGRFLYPSEVDNALSYDALDRSDSEASPDKFVGLGVSQFELVGFSQRTIEFYADTGATEQPFRPKKIAINRGCASRQSIVQIGGTLAWLGDDGIFYRLNGYREEAISTGPINKAITADNWANCFGNVWEDRKHEVAYWTFPDGSTWGWDAWTNLWHRRESFGLNRWRINAVDKWDDLWIAGDFQSGRLYAMDWDTYHENGQPLVASRTAPPIYNNGNKIVCPMLELVFDTGRGAPEPIEVSGDVPGGFAGQTVSTAYVATGGVGPYSFMVVSGDFPTGLVLATDGTVTGSFTEAGDFNWVVEATDSLGQTAQHSDSASVQPIPMFAVRTNPGIAATAVKISPDGVDWSAPWVDMPGVGTTFSFSSDTRSFVYDANNLQWTADGGATFTPATGTIPSAPSEGGWSETSGTIIIAPNARSTSGGTSFAANGIGGGLAMPMAGVWYSYDGFIHNSVDDGATWSASLGPFINFTNNPGFGGWAQDGLIVIGSKRGDTLFPAIVEITNPAGPYVFPTMPVGLLVNDCVINVTKGNGVWVAGLQSGKVIWRDSGGVWHLSPYQFPAAVNCLIFNGALFAAICGESGVGDGVIATSADGNTWTERLHSTVSNPEVWRQICAKRVV